MEGTIATTITSADSTDSNLVCFISDATDDAFEVNGIVIEGFNVHELKERQAFWAASSFDGSRNHF